MFTGKGRPVSELFSSVGRQFRTGPDQLPSFSAGAGPTASCRRLHGQLTSLGASCRCQPHAVTRRPAERKDQRVGEADLGEKRRRPEGGGAGKELFGVADRRVHQSTRRDG